MAPTIVLVHGAFADASGWSDVFHGLTARGYTAYAPANPLRGVFSDADYLRAFVATLDGPVILAGHSYGGCVITNASAGTSHVKGLVYVAAYAPDEGETLSDAGTLGGGSTDLTKHLVPRPYPGAPEGDADGYIDPAFFH
jgi:pimeloyl-ACP methyl ester carboxylesterase